MLALVAALLVVLLVLIAEVLLGLTFAAIVGAIGFLFNILLQKWFGLNDGQKLFIDLAELMMAMVLFTIFALISSSVAAAVLSLSLMVGIYAIIYGVICYFNSCPFESK